LDQQLIKENAPPEDAGKILVVGITEVDPAIHQTHAYEHIEGGQKGTY
jgi:hypothetical protein